MIDDDASELKVPSVRNNFAHQTLSRRSGSQTVQMTRVESHSRLAGEISSRASLDRAANFVPRPFIGGPQLGNMEIMLPISRPLRNVRADERDPPAGSEVRRVRSLERGISITEERIVLNFDH